MVLTYNRGQEVRRSLEKLLALPESPRMLVVDDASSYGTAEILRKHFPQVKLFAMECNNGSAARNIGVQQASTEYVPFCDDDSWWRQGVLVQAVELLDRHPRVAVLSTCYCWSPMRRKIRSALRWP